MDDVLAVESAAFSSDPTVPKLASDLIEDPSAKPVVSLLAFREDRAVGHVLFTRARLEPETPLSVFILAPLAVAPDFQKQGVGTALVQHGLRILVEAGTDLVFVLGHPAYYPRHGFQPALGFGFEPPYPIPREHSDAWMVQSLRPGAVDECGGRVVCADALMEPRHWRE